jgi:hypothetical protein
VEVVSDAPTLGGSESAKGLLEWIMEISYLTVLINCYVSSLFFLLWNFIYHSERRTRKVFWNKMFVPIFGLNRMKAYREILYNIVVPQ